MPANTACWEWPHVMSPMKMNMPYGWYNPQPKFVISQAVRVSASKTPFAKGYHPGWTEEIVTVTQCTATRPLHCVTMRMR